MSGASGRTTSIRRDTMGSITDADPLILDLDSETGGRPMVRVVGLAAT